MPNQRLQKLTEMLHKQPHDAFLHYAIGMEHLGLQETTEAEVPPIIN